MRVRLRMLECLCFAIGHACFYAIVHLCSFLFGFTWRVHVCLCVCLIVRQLTHRNAHKRHTRMHKKDIQASIHKHALCRTHMHKKRACFFAHTYTTTHTTFSSSQIRTNHVVFSPDLLGFCFITRDRIYCLCVHN